MSVVALQLLDGSAVNVEANDVASQIPIPAAMLPPGIAAGVRLTVDNVVTDVLGTAAAVAAIIAAGVGFAPTGAAGGDLAGTYPSPDVISAQAYQYAETDAQINQAAAANILAQRIDTPALVAGTYRIEWYGEQGNTALLSETAIRVDMDASSDVSNDGTAIAITQTVPTTINIFESRGGFRDMVLAAGVHIVRMKLSRAAGAGTAYVRMRRLAIWRVG